MTLSGKRAFVTAAGQGIGRAIAERFVADGATVTATDLNGTALEDLGGATILALDVTNKAALEAAVSSAAPDILVNCAGVVHAGTILVAEDADLDAAMALNVTPMFRAIRAAIPGMLDRGGGAIINIASVLGASKAMPNRLVYGTSKAAVVGLTKAVAADFVTQGIRCNAICPGTVDSPSLHERLRATGDYDQAMADFVARQPMLRLGTPAEMAALAAYLASDEAAYMTGQALFNDGGITI